MLISGGRGLGLEKPRGSNKWGRGDEKSPQENFFETIYIASIQDIAFTILVQLPEGLLTLSRQK